MEVEGVEPQEKPKRTRGKKTIEEVVQSQAPEVTQENPKVDEPPVQEAQSSPPPEPPKAEMKAVTPMLVDPEKGTLVARDNAELMRMLNVFMQGQAFPSSIDTPAKAAAAWNLACSLMPSAPQRAVARMMYVNGVLGIWGELPRALAEKTGELEHFKLTYIDKEYNVICLENKNLHVIPWAAVVDVKRTDRPMNQYYFTMDEAERAGLLNKKSPWTQGYAKAMLQWRASGMAWKVEFADALMGAEILEYRFNEAPEFKDVTPKTERTEVNIKDQIPQDLRERVQ